MPMLDAHIPQGALEPAAERELVARLIDIVLEWEGADPHDEEARAVSWLFLHRPAEVFVGGELPEYPRYRIVASVPEGQFDAERRNGLVRAVTEAVLDAEPPDRPRDPSRVWVFPHEVPEGTWGGNGRIVHLADIATRVLGADAETGRAHAKERLALTKAERDAVFS